jgi:hypothetical protein
MNDNELKRIEQESAELLALLHEVRDEDNAAVRTAPCPRPSKKKSLRISPYWLVAASVLGFVLGMAVPRDTDIATREYTTLLADTSYTIGRSLASGDINFALLVK